MPPNAPFAYTLVNSACGVAPRSPVTEWIRVWGYEVSRYGREGWRFSHAIVGGPSEQLFGSDYPVRQLTDGMMRDVTRG